MVPYNNNIQTNSREINNEVVNISCTADPLYNCNKATVSRTKNPQSRDVQYAIGQLRGLQSKDQILINLLISNLPTIQLT